jgi:hypothetical protein
MKVDPAGLASAAQRIAAALGQLPAGDQVHPPLGADPASQGAAMRLTTGATTLSALIAAQASGLAATAEVLAGIGAGFDGVEAANVANLSNLSGSAASAPVSGFAPPPLQAPDIRPPMPPPAAVLGEATSRAVHTGDPSAGAGFASGWSRVADAVDDAAGVVARVADNLPETWSSDVSTPVVRAHLLTYRTALVDSGARAAGLARQAGLHADNAAQARVDIPAPQEYTELNNQIAQAFRANAATGGKYAPVLAALQARKIDLDTKTAAGYGQYHLVSGTTTAPDPDDASAVPDTDPTDPATAAPATGLSHGPSVSDAAGSAPGSDPAANPAGAGQLAGMLPQLIPAVLGAAGGLVGGVMSTLTKAPEALIQAATQAASAATQAASGALGSNADGAGPGDPATTDPGGSDPGFGGDGGGGETSPASGGPSLPVLPSSGPAPVLPTMPAGALPDPVPASGPGGMGMGMPMGGMMPPGGGKAAGGGGQQPERVKGLVVPRTPHTESVTGKVGEDRIARSSTVSQSTDPDDDPPHPPADGARPLVRRITMAPARDDSA